MTIRFKGNRPDGIHDIEEINKYPDKLVTLYITTKNGIKAQQGIVILKEKRVNKNYNKNVGYWLTGLETFIGLLIGKDNRVGYQPDDIGRYFRLHDRADYILFKLEHDL